MIRAFAILGGEAVTLWDVLKAEGADAFMREHDEWAHEFAAHDWWFPYTVFDLRRMGVELFVDDRKEDAVSLFEFAVARHPDVYWLWEILGNIYVAIGDREQGVRCLEKALDLNPNDLYVRNSLNSLTRQDQWCSGRDGWIHPFSPWCANRRGSSAAVSRPPSTLRLITVSKTLKGRKGRSVGG